MDIDKLEKVLSNGGLAIIPTDTVYGILADATNENAIRRVFEVKQRAYDKPLIIMVSNFEMLTKYVDKISDLEKKIIKKYWPGRLTILFKKSKLVNGLINNNGDYVGIRLPDNEEIVKLIDKLGVPLVSTSANISDKDTATSIDMLDEEFLNKIDYIYDCGEIIALPSTIIKVDNGSIEYLREGDIANIIRSDFK